MRSMRGEASCFHDTTSLIFCRRSPACLPKMKAETTIPMKSPSAACHIPTQSECFSRVSGISWNCVFGFQICFYVASVSAGKCRIINQDLCNVAGHERGGCIGADNKVPYACASSIACYCLGAIYITETRCAIEYRCENVKRAIVVYRIGK